MSLSNERKHLAHRPNPQYWHTWSLIVLYYFYFKYCLVQYSTSTVCMGKPGFIPFPSEKRKRKYFLFSTIHMAKKDSLEVTRYFILSPFWPLIEGRDKNKGKFFLYRHRCQSSLRWLHIWSCCKQHKHIIVFLIKNLPPSQGPTVYYVLDSSIVPSISLLKNSPWGV